MIKNFLEENATISDAIQDLNESHSKISLVLSQERTLIGTITDGDIRRGLLKGLSITSPITNIIQRNALVVPPNMSRDMVLQLMIANKIHQIPVVDANKKVVGLHLWEDISTTINPQVRTNIMVIMAGGKGIRLRPYTENCPKPMLLVAGKPMLEHIIERAKSEGFFQFVISIYYLGHIIEEYFGSGEKLGVKIDYLREQSPLGTAGALGLLNPLPSVPFVVTNGDVITDIRYGELLDFHVRNNAAATMAVRVYEWQHPFGVVKIDGLEIVGFEEKPVDRSHINAGIYVIDPHVLKYLKNNDYCDMPTLFERLKHLSIRTIAYPMHEPWLDVGRPDDLIIANSDGK